MNLEITRTVEQKETIEIEFPYYYKHDLLLDNSDSVIYGKVEEHKHTQIHLRDDYRGGTEFSVEVEKRPAATLACYMTDEHRSNEAEYLAAKEKLLAAAQAA